MSEVWSGGCQCGAVRFEVAADEVLTLVCCHCRECQRQSASAFGMSLILPRAAFTLLQGELRRFQWRSHRGTVQRGNFCPGCGVRIYNDNAGDEVGNDGGISPWISVKAGTLDDTRMLRPVGHLWTERAQPWVSLSQELLLYPAEPDSDDAINAAYRKRTRP